MSLEDWSKNNYSKILVLTKELLLKNTGIQKDKKENVCNSLFQLII